MHLSHHCSSHLQTLFLCRAGGLSCAFFTAKRGSWQTAKWELSEELLREVVLEKMLISLPKILLSDRFTPAASSCYLAPLELHWNKGLSRPRPCQGHQSHPSQQVTAALAPGSSRRRSLALLCSSRQRGASRRL